MIRSQISVSLDGYVAGPDQSDDDPLGAGGEQLHEWAFRTGTDADRALAHEFAHAGAYVMGRNMFGPVRGPWDRPWTGWWGERPPYEAPVFVLTHFPRDPITLAGGTTFHFVCDGIDAALDRAVEAAGDHDVHVSGGASCLQQALRTGRVRELLLHIAPVLLGGGARLLEDVGDVRLTPIEVRGSLAVTHVRYWVERP